MARLSFRVRLVLGIVTIALPAVAAAPDDQYVKFTSDSIEIDDVHTLLKWDRYQIEQVQGSLANNYCNLAVFPGSGRVPTVKELLTLVDEDGHQSNVYDGTRYPYVYFDASAFPDRRTPYDAPYWTSTKDPAGSDSYFVVDFRSGVTSLHAATEKLNVRCVKK